MSNKSKKRKPLTARQVKAYVADLAKLAAKHQAACDVCNAQTEKTSDRAIERADARREKAFQKYTAFSDAKPQEVADFLHERDGRPGRRAA